MKRRFGHQLQHPQTAHPALASILSKLKESGGFTLRILLTSSYGTCAIMALDVHPSNCKRMVMPVPGTWLGLKPATG